MSAFIEVMDLAQQAASLMKQRDAASEEFALALEVSGVQLIRERSIGLKDDAEIGDVVKILRQVDTSINYARYYATRPGDLGHAHWVSQPINVEVRQESTGEFAHTYLGEHVLIGWSGGDVVLAPIQSVRGGAL